MLYTRNTIEYRDSTLAALVPAAVGVEGRLDDFTERRDRLAAEPRSTFPGQRAEDGRFFKG